MLKFGDASATRHRHRHRHEHKLLLLYGVLLCSGCTTHDESQAQQGGNSGPRLVVLYISSVWPSPSYGTRYNGQLPRLRTWTVSSRRKSDTSASMSMRMMAASWRSQHYTRRGGGSCRRVGGTRISTQPLTFYFVRLRRLQHAGLVVRDQGGDSLGTTTVICCPMPSSKPKKIYPFLVLAWGSPSGVQHPGLSILSPAAHEGV